MGRMLLKAALIADQNRLLTYRPRFDLDPKKLR